MFLNFIASYALKKTMKNKPMTTLALVFSLWSLFVGTGCKPETPPDPPQPPDTDTFVVHPQAEVRWTTHYTDDKKYAKKGIICDDLIVFMIYETGNGFVDRLLALDKHTGDTAWTWDKGANFMGYLTHAEQTVYFYDGYNAIVYALDALTGEERWNWTEPDCRDINGLIVADGRVYVGAHYGYHGLRGMHHTNLTALDAQTGSPTVIHRFVTPDRNNNTLTLYDPQAWYNAQGDLILAYSGSDYNEDNGPTSTENYIAYNITADSIYFEHRHYWPTTAAGRGGINVIGDKYVFTNTLSNETRKIACMDLATQTIDWETTIPAKLINAHIQFYDLGNTWVSNSGNFGITYGIDPATEKLIWYNDSFHYGFKYPVLYSGYGWNRKNGQIVVFDPATSTIRYQIENKDLHEGIFLAIKNGTANQGWFSSLTIDPTTGYIYTCGENRLTCFQFIE